MEKQPLIRIDGVFESDHVNATDLSGTVTNEFGSLFSLFPGSDWFLFGGVAIQADPCDSFDCHLGDQIVPLSCEEAGCSGGCGLDCHQERVGPCSKCHGLGVIPRHGRLEWRCVGTCPVPLWEATGRTGYHMTGCSWVVPIKGGNPPATI